MLVVHDHHGGQLHQVAQQDLSARTVRQAQGGFFPQHKRQQLQASPREAPDLQKTVLAVMTTNFLE